MKTTEEIKKYLDELQKAGEIERWISNYSDKYREIYFIIFFKDVNEEIFTHTFWTAIASHKGLLCGAIWGVKDRIISNDKSFDEYMENLNRRGLINDNEEDVTKQFYRDVLQTMTNGV